MSTFILKFMQSPLAAIIFFGLALYFLWKGLRYLYAARWYHLLEAGNVTSAKLSELLRPKKLLTQNEQEFYSRLRSALPEFEVFPQVAMAAILDTTLDETHPLYWDVRKLFSQKICDYVVCSQQLKLLAVIELDDRTHDNKKEQDARRDALLAQAGISTVRWDSRSKPDTATIRLQFAAQLAGV